MNYGVSIPTEIRDHEELGFLSESKSSVRSVEILAHRGWWDQHEERNTTAALERALEAGFGIETDVRDRQGVLVISHDVPDADSRLLEDLLQTYSARGWSGVLGLNIKSDGLAAMLRPLLDRYDVSRYFTFDMSVPDTLGYIAIQAKPFTRWSEYERGSSLDDRADGVWMDSFGEDFVCVADIRRAAASGKRVAIVSPELHGRPHLEAWTTWRKSGIRTISGEPIMLCTDFPDKAAAFFNDVEAQNS